MFDQFDPDIKHSVSSSMLQI